MTRFLRFFRRRRRRRRRPVSDPGSLLRPSGSGCLFSSSSFQLIRSQDPIGEAEAEAATTSKISDSSQVQTRTPRKTKKNGQSVSVSVQAEAENGRRSQAKFWSRGRGQNPLFQR